MGYVEEYFLINDMYLIILTIEDQESGLVGVEGATFKFYTVVSAQYEIYKNDPDIIHESEHWNPTATEVKGITLRDLKK